VQIPEAVLCAGALRFGATIGEIRFLGGGGPGADGVVYSFNRDGAEWTLKFKPGGYEAVRRNIEKLVFVRYLAERGVSVACPQFSTNSRLAEVVTSGQDSFIVSSENVVAGRYPNTRNPLEWNEAFFFR
jgi:Ser/Thr protein kinase RdoA (MazF antagonist)